MKVILLNIFSKKKKQTGGRLTPGVSVLPDDHQGPPGSFTAALTLDVRFLAESSVHSQAAKAQLVCGSADVWMCWRVECISITHSHSLSSNWRSSRCFFFYEDRSSTSLISQSKSVLL